MKFLLISQTKLKVTLTKEEAELLNIKLTDGEYDNKQIKQALKEVLKEAKRVADFDIGTDKVLVQLYPAGDGCEIFITRLGILGRNERNTLERANNLTTYRKEESVYLFDSLDTLTDACRAVRERSVESDVYISDRGEYYLVVREGIISGIGDCDILAEYSSRLPALPERIKGERGKLLVKGKGIEIFSHL